MDPELEAEMMAQTMMDPGMGVPVAPGWNKPQGGLGAVAPMGTPSPQRSPQDTRPPMRPQMPPQQAAPQQMPQQFNPTQMQKQMMDMNSIPYTINRGDTLTKIARNMNTTVEAIRKFNPEIVNINRIFPGQEIRVPMAGGIREQSMGQGSPLLDDMMAGPQADPSRYSHQGFTPPENMNRDLMMGAAAGLLPMAGIAGATGGLTNMMMGGLGAMANAAPRLIPPGSAGRPVMPMSKGAVDWAGAAKTGSNVRPLDIPIGAQRMMGQQAREALAKARAMEPRGMTGNSFDSRMGLPRNAPPMSPRARIDPPMTALEQLFAALGR